MLVFMFLFLFVFLFMFMMLMFVFVFRSAERWCRVVGDFAGHRTCRGSTEFQQRC